MRRAARWRGADLQHCDALVRQGLRQIHRPARPQRRADRATPIQREVLTPPPNMRLNDQRITSVLAIADGIEQSALPSAAFLVLPMHELYPSQGEVSSQARFEIKDHLLVAGTRSEEGRGGKGGGRTGK